MDAARKFMVFWNKSATTAVCKVKLIDSFQKSLQKRGAREDKE
jgi:hypothetical protein